jgi:hypothetical protein
MMIVKANPASQTLKTLLNDLILRLWRAIIIVGNHTQVRHIFIFLLGKKID